MCNGSVEGAGAPHIVDNRGKKALPIGVENFDAVVRTGVYVDKTLLIRDLLDTVQGSTTLFCRPRRFGKSLAMRMLQCFFEAPVDGMIPSKRHLFENLAAGRILPQRAGCPPRDLSHAWRGERRELGRGAQEDCQRRGGGI